MDVMTLSTIMPPPTCGKHKAKKCILGDIWPYCDLDPKIWCIHPCPEVR